MNNLYLIGGSPRSGKTIIFNTVIIKKPMVAISSDGLREGLRFAITDESFVNINDLIFDGQVSFHRSGEDNSVLYTKSFTQRISQDDLTWKMICGLINFYDNKNIPIIIEGMVITPERVKNLTLKNLQIKAAFVGFTDNLHLKTILEYAHLEKDWVYKKIMEENNGDSTVIKNWYQGEKEKNKETAFLAKKYGYGFFSPNEGPFDKFCDKVTDYLLQP